MFFLFVPKFVEGNHLASLPNNLKLHVGHVLGTVLTAWEVLLTNDLGSPALFNSCLGEDGGSQDLLFDHSEGTSPDFSDFSFHPLINLIAALLSFFASIH